MEKVEFTLDALQKMMSKNIENIQEERDLALERYRRQDEQITSAEDFILQGKNAVDYLKTAAERSNTMLMVTKLLKDIVIKDDGKPAGGDSIGDDVKKEIERMLKEKD